MLSANFEFIGEHKFKVKERSHVFKTILPCIEQLHFDFKDFGWFRQAFGLLANIILRLENVFTFSKFFSREWDNFILIIKTSGGFSYLRVLLMNSFQNT